MERNGKRVAEVELSATLLFLSVPLSTLILGSLLFLRSGGKTHSRGRVCFKLHKPPTSGAAIFVATAKARVGKGFV